ncbi:bifunctional riboflavin kinase/FAD synthetase [Lunatibacter salilacus]|uniref:bifunctional riboflavin kinase/FAD synthetase n=1 Tax=Lunatibacter salilacus TaxID=2483804 RepID=UPI00131CD861|nr:bifunctional riboflavin kinase/FAD synthetase [Lunatibacter salilacus]
MKIYDNFNDFQPIPHAVVTIGTFDGVHLGHQKILNRLRILADQSQGETVLITFWPHPRMVLRPDSHNIKLLSTFEEKNTLLEEYGVDHLVSIPFTKAFSETSSEEFIHHILIEKIKTKILVIGYDHKFGKGREGGFEHLHANQEKYGFVLEEIPREDIDSIGISSTKIRQALEKGDIVSANNFLGRPYALRGEVIQGKQIGRSIGFPTANIEIADLNKLIPGDGSYIVQASVEGRTVNGMLNIGHRPTLSGLNKTVEVHLFDFDRTIYGVDIDISFLEFLRPEIKFSGLDELKDQLDRDRIRARGFFDAR